MTTPHLDKELIARFDALEGEAREGMLRHAAECSSCSEKLAADDPARIFAMLALDSPEAEALEKVSKSVMLQLGERQAGSRSTILVRSLASVAASLMLAGVFGVYMMGYRGSGPTASLEPLPEAPAVSGGIELISSPGEAQVMEFTVGETQIVMIFDEAMDI